MLPRIRLKYILFITFTLIASLPVLILAGWVQESALDKEISSVKEKHLLVARNLTGDLERYVIDVESSLELISDNMIKGIKVDGIPKHLDSLFLRYVRITDAAGNITKQVTALSKTKTDQFDPDTLKILLPIMKTAHGSLGNVFYSDMVRTGENETTFYLIKAMKNEQYVIAALSTTHILNVQQKISFGRRGHVAIVDRTGRAIAHPVANWVKTSKDMSFLPPVKKMMQGETGVSKFYTPAMKADMVAGYTVVPQTGWGVMVPQPFEELEERANDVRFIALTIALIGIAISGLISWYIASILCNPIQSVVDATEFASDGSQSPLVSSVSITQRFIPHELRILLNSFNFMRTNINTLTSKLHSKIDLANAAVAGQNLLLQHQSKVLMENNKKLELLTFTDSLTDLFNRRHFDSALGKELAHAQRHKETFSLMMIDLDHFKHINDGYGHSAGDKVLLETAKIITNNVRKSDIVCRVGGEEFAIIFRQAGSQEIRIIAETLRKKVEQHPVTNHDQTISITASIGIATFRGDSEVDYTQDGLYKHADSAMYHSKNQGRNQITHFDDIAEMVLQNQVS
jgi:diguanylate cyclase (GGDEF)-like protein